MVPVDWLLEGPAFVRYRCLTDLIGKADDDPDVVAAYRGMIADPLVASLIREVNAWEHQYPITRHNDSVHPLHKLVFAAALGLKRAELEPALAAIMSHQSPEGPLQIRIRIPKAFGGDDVPKWDWVATDAPLILYSLLRLGVRDERVMRGVRHILGRIGESGFPCFASASMGKFKGPGRRGDPCPYANLIILRMMAQVPELVDSPVTRRTAEMLLHHWEVRGEKKYYLFGIGRDFVKLKAPRVWYDLVHYLDTLTRFPFARGDSRLREAAGVLASKADREGRFTAESVWTKWKGWEFCQKREPSRWLTLLAHRILMRMSV